jgi:hypothetical protein
MLLRIDNVPSEAPILVCKFLKSSNEFSTLICPSLSSAQTIREQIDVAPLICTSKTLPSQRNRTWKGNRDPNRDESRNQRGSGFRYGRNVSRLKGFPMFWCGEWDSNPRRPTGQTSSSLMSGFSSSDKNSISRTVSVSFVELIRVRGTLGERENGRN